MKYFVWIMASLMLVAAAATAKQQTMNSYSTLTEGQMISGFRTAAVYLNASEVPLGARFIHQKSGFTLDLLEIQSVPQAFVWVTTFPSSDMGEPHTQEHLLLGKGNKGRTVASHEPMSLSGSSAFTMQWRTCYHFNTAAGSSVFYGEFERRLDALLHPDYSDEEVRREVRNFGITEDPVNGSLGLEEKGSVYNEMVSSMDQPQRRIYRAALATVYGPRHPLAYNSGGSPEALRIIQPSDIRRFHAAHYHLANMGAVISAPREMTPETILAAIDGLLNRVEPLQPHQPLETENDLPRPTPSTEGAIQFVEYPHRNDQQPASVWFVWPAERTLDLTEQTLLGLFLENLAGDASTNLYKRFIDSRTREIELGAQNVFGSVIEEQGRPVIIGFGDVPVAKVNESDIADLKTRVLQELNRVASWPNGSAELKEFNERMLSRVIETRRNLSKFVNSPPGFGFRGTGAEWMTHLDALNKETGFRKSLTMKDVLTSVEGIVSGTNNVWGTYLAKWKLQDSNPWAMATRPNPALIPADQEERQARLSSELSRLKILYGVTGDQEAIQRYKREYEANTAVIDREASAVSPPKFIDNPPMTLDDQLRFEYSQIRERIPLVTSTFDSMTSATTGIALRLDGVQQDRLFYLSMLPQLLLRVGVIENGKAVPYEEMSERLRKEVLSLNADFSTNPRTGRVELVIRGSGNDISESQRAIEWMRLVLFQTDWRRENLPRIRDLVDQTLGNMRRTMQTAEENWVRGVANAWWRQNDPLFLTTTSFMTQVHNIQRLRWMLKDVAAPERAATVSALNNLAQLKGTRSELEVRLAELQAGPDKLLAEAAKDLDLTLPDIPDSSLEDDWAHLCTEMAADLTAGPARALAAMDLVRQQLLRVGNARFFLIGSTSAQQVLTPLIQGVATELSTNTALKADYDRTNLVTRRLLERDPSANNPVFVGLLNPNSQSGVFLNSAGFASYEDRDRDKLLDYLAANLYAGGGGHSIFMKTWSAGLAYSNGLSARLSEGRLGYYAERTPELPQTLRFVINELKQAKPDPALVEYAVAQAFGGTRSASAYETRGEQMAANLADGIAPHIVSGFHEGILELRKGSDLAAELFQRMNQVYARVLPGMTNARTPMDGVYFVIGPEKQFTAWEDYLKAVEGPTAKLYRLYPRDFWLH